MIMGACYTSPEEFMLPEKRRCIQMHEVEKIIRVDYNLAWLPEPNESQIALSSQLPPRELVSTALVVAFAGDRLLMTELVSRGWDIPGGHVEPVSLPPKLAHLPGCGLIEICMKRLYRSVRIHKACSKWLLCW